MAILERIGGILTPAARKKTEPFYHIPASVAAPTVPYERPINRSATRPLPAAAERLPAPDSLRSNRQENPDSTQLLFGIAGDVDLRVRRTIAGSASLEEFIENLDHIYPTRELRSFFIDYYKFLIGDTTAAGRFTNQAEFADSLSGLHSQVEAYLLAQFSHLSSDNRAFTVGTDHSSGQVEYPHFVPVDTEVVEQYIQEELNGILDAIHIAAMHTVNAAHTQENSPPQGSAWKHVSHRIRSFFQRT